MKNNNSRYPESANEPKVHPLIRKSFVFVPTAGMRHAPEMLLLEFFREVFYKDHFGTTGGKDLDPDDNGNQYSKEARAVLNALRGRRRKSNNSKEKSFFAPAYPALTQNAWLRKNSDRVIQKLLLEGPIAQHLWMGGETEPGKRKQEDFITSLLNTLIGHNSSRNGDYMNKDIFSVALRNERFEIDESLAKDKIRSLTRSSDSIINASCDNLSERIFKDLNALCELEKYTPRMQWLQVFMTFLRFSLPMWLLAHMRITSLIHESIIAVLEGAEFDPTQFENKINNRNSGLLHPSLTPTREIFERTEEYMKKRVELNIFLYLLEDFRKDKIAKKRLVLNGAGATVINAAQLLQICSEVVDDFRSSAKFSQLLKRGSFQDLLTREAEPFSAWRDPLKKGQGKNIDEFFRVLYRDNLGDELGGYLFIPNKARGQARGFCVFPGQLLLKTITFLAAFEKRNNNEIKGGGKMILGDVEKHFQQYGIDFSYAADARPLLMKELQAMGLLTGSPDAGDSVAVTPPFEVRSISRC